MQNKFTRSISTRKIKAQKHLFDASEWVLGRMASQIALILMGKHRVDYTPHVDSQDEVAVINTQKIRVTGNKDDKKIYHHHTHYPGGLRAEKLGSLRKRKPNQIIYLAVKRMLPKNRLAALRLKRLHLFPDPAPNLKKEEWPIVHTPKD